MIHRVAVAGLLSALALGACSNDPDRTSRGPDPAPVETTFVNGGDCPPSEKAVLPRNAGCVSTVTASGEELIVYARLNDSSRPKGWHIALSSGGEIVDQVLHAGNDFSYPRVVGSSDVNGDGRAEWWVRVVDYTSHGAPWSGLNLFFTKEDALVPLSFDGKPLVVNYGGIARLGEGATCSRDRLTLLRAEAKNVRNTRWQVSERSYHLAGTEAHFLRRTEAELTIEDYNDPDLDPYYRVDCEGFVFPS